MKKYLVVLTDKSKGILFFDESLGGNVGNLKNQNVKIHLVDSSGNKTADRKSGTLFKILSEVI